MGIVKNRKSWDEIDVNEVLIFEDFCTLFEERISLNEEEKSSLVEYYEMYEIFLHAEVRPIEAWIATRNIFVIKNMQIAERIKNEKTST